MTSIDRCRRVVVVDLARASRRPSAATCGPTRSATSAARAPRRPFVVDIVLHLEGDAIGPGSLLGGAATVGDRLVLLAPRRGYPFGGIEFTPGPGAEPAAGGRRDRRAGRLRGSSSDLPDDATGAAFLEVPSAADILDVRRPAGRRGRLAGPRGRRARGAACTTRYVAHLGHPGRGGRGRRPTRWTPTCGRRRTTPPPARRSTAAATVGHDVGGTYAWIAGESTVVTGLRRHLVNELGFDRRQVAFMGYWRRGRRDAVLTPRPVRRAGRGRRVRSAGAWRSAGGEWRTALGDAVAGDRARSRLSELSYMARAPVGSD